MKKILYGVMAMIAAVAVIGCEPANETPAPEPTPDPDPVIVTYSPTSVNLLNKVGDSMEIMVSEPDFTVTVPAADTWLEATKNGAFVTFTVKELNPTAEVRTSNVVFEFSKEGVTPKKQTYNVSQEAGKAVVPVNPVIGTAYDKDGVKGVIFWVDPNDATKAKIDGRIDDEKFVKWLEKLFAGVVEKKGIRNDRDWFTSSGNRRKWEQLYDEITLDNVVDAMQKQASKGGEGLFGGSIFGSAQKEYSSIDEIRNSAKERIQAINEDDYQAQRDAITNRLSSIEIPGAGRGFSGTMDMIQNIQDAVTKSHTAKGIHKYLKRFYPKVTLEIAKEIEGIVKDIQRMSARYFEAKPYRAVGFEEVRLAIVPSDTDASLVEQLKQKGIEIRTYERGNQKQRKQIADEATRELNLRFQFIGEQGAEESTSGEDTKNPTWEEITDALESTPTSHTEVPGVKMHSSKSDTAKIHNNEAIAKDLEKLGESFNNNYAFSAKEFIGQLALRFNIPANTENTSYKQIQTPNGKITVRLSNHQGNAINFILKNSNNQNNYGIVIKTERNLFKDNENVNYL